MKTISFRQEYNTGASGFFWGATEGKVSVDVPDDIADMVETSGMEIECSLRPGNNTIVQIGAEVYITCATCGQRRRIRENGNAHNGPGEHEPQRVLIDVIAEVYKKWVKAKE